MLQQRFRLMPEESILRVLSHGDYDHEKHWVTVFVLQQKLVVFNGSFRARLSHFSKYRLQTVLTRIRGPRTQPLCAVRVIWTL